MAWWKKFSGSRGGGEERGSVFHDVRCEKKLAKLKKGGDHYKALKCWVRMINQSFDKRRVEKGGMGMP